MRIRGRVGGSLVDAPNPDCLLPGVGLPRGTGLHGTGQDCTGMILGRFLGPNRNWPRTGDRTVQDCTGLYRTVKDWAGLDRTGKDCTGLYRTVQGLDRTVQDWTGLHWT